MKLSVIATLGRYADTPEVKKAAYVIDPRDYRSSCFKKQLHGHAVVFVESGLSVRVEEMTSHYRHCKEVHFEVEKAQSKDLAAVFPPHIIQIPLEDLYGMNIQRPQLEHSIVGRMVLNRGAEFLGKAADFHKEDEGHVLLKASVVHPIDGQISPDKMVKFPPADDCQYTAYGEWRGIQFMDILVGHSSVRHTMTSIQYDSVPTWREACQKFREIRPLVLETSADEPFVVEGTLPNDTHEESYGT